MVGPTPSPATPARRLVSSIPPGCSAPTSASSLRSPHDRAPDLDQPGTKILGVVSHWPIVMALPPDMPRRRAAALRYRRHADGTAERQPVERGLTVPADHRLHLT